MSHSLSDTFTVKNKNKRIKMNQFYFSVTIVLNITILVSNQKHLMTKFLLIFLFLLWTKYVQLHSTEYFHDGGGRVCFAHLVSFFNRRLLSEVILHFW